MRNLPAADITTTKHRRWPLCTPLTLQGSWRSYSWSLSRGLTSPSTSDYHCRPRLHPEVVPLRKPRGSSQLPSTLQDQMPLSLALGAF